MAGSMRTFVTDKLTDWLTDGAGLLRTRASPKKPEKPRSHFWSSDFPLQRNFDFFLMKSPGIRVLFAEGQNITLDQFLKFWYFIGMWLWIIQSILDFKLRSLQISQVIFPKRNIMFQVIHITWRVFVAWKLYEWLQGINFFLELVGLMNQKHFFRQQARTYEDLR